MECTICGNKRYIQYKCDNCKSIFYANEKLSCLFLNKLSDLMIDEYIHYVKKIGFLYTKQFENTVIDFYMDDFESLSDKDKYNILKQLADNLIFI